MHAVGTADIPNPTIWRTKISTVYQDTVAPLNGSYRLKNQYGTWSYASGGTPTTVFRRGLRRPKPEQLDDTPYTLQKRIGGGGVRGKWETFIGSSNPQSYEGLVNTGDLHTASQTRITGRQWWDPNPVHGTHAHTRAMAKLNRSDLDLGAAFGEAGKSAQLLGDIGLFTARFTKAVMRKDGKAIRDMLTSNDYGPERGGRHGRLPGSVHGIGRNTVDTYLAYHYGVAPMINDVNGLVQAATRLPVEEWRVRAKGGYEETRERKLDVAFGPCETRTAVTRVDSARCTIWATRRPITRSQDLAWALGLDNPLRSAYELAPYSSVLDWALPIGTWLDGLNALKYYTGWTTSLTTYVREEIAVSGSKGRTAINKNTWSSDVSGKSESVAINRTISTQPTIPGLAFKNPVSMDHVAKGLSLLASAAARGGELPRYLRT